MKGARSSAQAVRNIQDDLPKRRHPLVHVIGVFAFCMIAYGGYLSQRLLDPNAFPIKKIAVEGEFHHLTTDHVQQLVSEAVHGGFFAVDVGMVRDRIIDEPWVFDAAVRRVWPDTIRVSITEQHAVARWGEYGLLNDAADIFVPEDAAVPKGLVTLNGPIGSESDVLKTFKETREILSRVSLAVEAIQLSERRAWRIKIENGATLVIGRHSVNERLNLFNRAYGSVLKSSWDRVVQVDLRYTNGFAVQQGSLTTSDTPVDDQNNPEA